MKDLKRLLSQLTLRQKISLVVAAIAVAGGLYSLAHWNRERDFRPLYTGMAPEDAGAVVARLREAGVQYRLSDSGTTILVPSAAVAETRLQMATSGLPRSGRIGFELFDQNNFGTTDFAERVNYHRALEGELERSVMALAEVERARVHITLPKESVFLESRKPAKASVLVKLRPAAKLSPANVVAICHLLSSAVDGLEPQAVSVLDMHGNLLNRPRLSEPLNGVKPSEAHLEYRQSIERDLLSKINSTLEPLLGPEAFRASVSVDCDFTSGEQSEEVYDPSRSVMANSQRTEDISGMGVTAGVPGSASNLPRPTSRPDAGSRGYTRKTENIAYQSTRTVRRVRLPQGAVKRMSVSLLVDHTVRWHGAGESAKRVVEAPSPEKLKAIRELVAGAIGLQSDRGDQLVVEALPFESTENWRPEEAPPAAPPFAYPLPGWLQEILNNDAFKGKAAPVAIGVAAGALLLLGALALILMKRRKRRLKIEATTKALPAGDEAARAASEAAAKLNDKIAEQAAIKAKLEQEALHALKIPAATKKTDVLVKHLTDEARKDPKTMAQLIRTWLHEETD
ncbi:MAG: flagellar M-ring protein FliF [Bryobacteraceae bacterium]|nr:flagellar M-ring protein FliF [Bryobacteraceae bacterium]